MNLLPAKIGVDRAADMLLPPERRGRNTLRAAMHIACTAHDRDVAELIEKLEKMAANDPGRLVELVVVLAGLVDVDKTPSQMLAWMCPPKHQPAPRAGAELCGTVDGHIAHVQDDEDPCRPCQAAFDRETRPVKKRGGPAECSTPAGWQRHKRQGQKPCEGCKEAMRAYWRGQYAENYRPVGTNNTKLIGCPSRAGYDRHIRRNEDPCEGCIAERRRYFRERARDRYQRQGRELKPCKTSAARERHRRARERCLTCWPLTVNQPVWYPAPDAALTNLGGTP